MTAPGPGPVVVVGGCGAVGAMLVTALRGDGRSVLTVDPAAGALPDDSAVVGDICVPSETVAAAVRTAAIVILAVPDAVAIRALPTLPALMRADALLVETLSVKTPIAVALRTHLPDRQALGINPMFAPALGLPGRPVAAVRHRDGPAVAEFVDAMRRWGAVVVDLGADDHDRATAATQALTHAVVLAFGGALDRLDPPPAAASTAPPPHMLLRALLARVAAGTPEVYHDIQVANPYAADARRALREALDELDAAATLPQFLAVTDRARAPLGDDLEQYRAMCGELLTMLPTALPGPDAVRNGVPR